MLAGTGLAVAAMLVLAISVFISGQSNGVGQILLAITALAGLGIAVLSPFLWLVEESRSVITRYNSQHRRDG
jgi:hypothetical protein